MIKKLKKILSNAAIICLVVSAVIGLLLLFKVIEASRVIGAIMLSILTIFVSAIFLLTSADVLDKSKKFGIFSVSSIALSAVLFIILIWCWFITKSVNEVFLKVNVAIAAISLLANLIFSTLISLGKHLLPLQFLCYACFIYIETIIIIIIFTGSGDFLEGLFATFFVAVCIIFVVLYIVLKIKAKNNENYVTITKEEYEALKNRIKELEEKISA